MYLAKNQYLGSDVPYWAHYWRKTAKKKLKNSTFFKNLSNSMYTNGNLIDDENVHEGLKLKIFCFENFAILR